MSRAGYSDDYDDSSYPAAMWRGAVLSAIRGKRGQSFLLELLAALDALPEKKLAANSFTRGGEICALGSVAMRRGLDVSEFEPHPDEWGSEDEVDSDALSKKFGIAAALAREIMYENDEGSLNDETPEQRWIRVRAWVASQIESGNGTS
jgi:hypothetical protein